MRPVIRRSFPALFTVALAVGAAGLSSPGFAQGVKTVGGAPMYPSQNIVQNAVNSKDHTTLVTAVKAADLAGQTIRIDAAYVNERVGELSKNADLSRFIL